MPKIKPLILVIAMVFSLSTVLSSCGNKEEPPQESTLKQYTEEMEAKLDQMEGKIQDLKEQIEEKGGEMQATLERVLDELREKRSTAETKLEELKQKGGGEAWDQAKTEIDEAVKNLESSYEDLRERLRISN